MPCRDPSDASTDHVDSRRRVAWVDDHTLARLFGLDEQFAAAILLGDEGGDVRLEASGAHTHDDDGDDKARGRTMAVLNDTRDGGDDEEDVTEERDTNRHADRLEATPSCVRDVGAKEGNHVYPVVKRAMSHLDSAAR